MLNILLVMSMVVSIVIGVLSLVLMNIGHFSYNDVIGDPSTSRPPNFIYCMESSVLNYSAFYYYIPFGAFFIFTFFSSISFIYSYCLCSIGHKFKKSSSVIDSMIANTGNMDNLLKKHVFSEKELKLIGGEKQNYKKLALVMSNGKYKNITELEAAVNDGKAIEKLLKEDFSFDVTSFYDSDEMIDDFGLFESKVVKESKNLSSGKELLVVVFYSGHGYVYDDNELLLPIDFEKEMCTLRIKKKNLDKFGDDHKEREKYIQKKKESVRRNILKNCLSVQKILSSLGNLNAKVLFFVDACRTRMDIDVPLSEKTRGRGCDFLISYSTKPGEVAFDKTSTNHSPYTESLIELLKKNGEKKKSLYAILCELKEKVEDLTDNNQTPIISGSININWPI